eukprot:TRINITY_DN93786_c0_g1_i1.p1 TRINITY_DN93786_c0_g1~~TRINITY_DN93786_c0_g1_i1.p1  ORF type:complete len:243 (-),score=26.29 TRINITY_DN93786_c0_g1_i1:238-903(-)
MSKSITAAEIGEESKPIIAGDKWGQVYNEAWENGHGWVAEEVASTDLNDAQKIRVQHVYTEVRSKDKDVAYYRRLTTSLFIFQAASGAAVPILIPFGQTYAEKPKDIFGWHISNFGEVILVFAVFCSLVGSIAMVVERAGKYAKLAHAYNYEAEMKLNALTRFLALGGPFKRYKSHTEAYPQFMDEVAHFLEVNSRARIFGQEVGSSQGQKPPGNEAEQKQ